MFNLSRYFSLTSALVLVVATVGVITLYRNLAVDEIVSGAETENTGLAQSFADHIWPAFAPHFRKANETDLGELRTSYETAALGLSLESLTRGKPVLKVRIYTAGGRLAFSSTIDEIGAFPEEPGSALEAAMAGQVSSALRHRSDYLMPSGAFQDRDLVETHLPIFNPDGQVEGIFELHTDVTDLMGRIRETISGMIMAILLAFAVLYGALFLIVRRADGILKAQYQDLLTSREKIQAHNEELQREIGERIRVEKELISASEAAQAANRAKSEFLANMSHELRTPLNAVIGFSEAMLQEVFGPIRNKKYVNYVRDIGGAGRHLLAIINDILDLSKVEAGQDKLDAEDMDICEHVGSCLALLRGWAEKAEVDLKADLPEEPMVIRADARKFRQILLNLVSNAIKFTPAGGEVSIKTWRDQDRCCVVQVSDTGIGMSPGDIPKAMSIFGQVDSGLSRQYEGTGLGLPLAKRFADLHGASLEVESGIGVGTTVTVRFGRARDQDSGPKALPAPDAPADAPPDAPKTRAAS